MDDESTLLVKLVYGRYLHGLFVASYTVSRYTHKRGCRGWNLWKLELIEVYDCYLIDSSTCAPDVCDL